MEDWEDYKKWKEGQGRKDELPAAPQVFLADTSLLFYQDPDVQLPWIHRLKCELPRRVGRLSGDLPVKASFIGFGVPDSTQQYDEFKRAMAQIGIVLCRQIHHPPSRFEIAHLEQSDLVMVSGGDRRRLWETLGTDIGSSAVAEHVKWRYLQGAVVVAVGEAMSLLGDKSWYGLGAGKPAVPFTGWKIFPHTVASEEEDADLEDMVEHLGGAGVVIFGLHKGCGMIFNRDGLVEPVGGMMQEYRWDWQTKSVKRAILLGPPRSTGLICPLYAAMQREGGEADQDETADVWAYALTQEEEHEEEHFAEQFDVHNCWLSPDALREVEVLKAEGNEAFKSGKADVAGLKYEQARVQLQSSAKPWSELTKDTQKQLASLTHTDTSTTLPSEMQLKATKGFVGKKDDYRATTVLLSLLLNLSVCHLLAFEQDQQRRDKLLSAVADPHDVANSAAEPSRETTIVQVRNNLVAAFRAANEALRISGARSAKAWYRRGCAFQQMRDPRNAFRDFEEALLRAPGDKGISNKRDEVREPAGVVAENMYYARHKELDAEAARLDLPTRRHLFLRGAFGDAFADDLRQFAVAQPLAWVIPGTMQEVDGKPSILLDELTAHTPAGPHLHPHALWTWEYIVQTAKNLQILQIEDIDLGSGPLEWLCKGLRAHREVRVLRLIGVHVGPAGAKMLRNVVAQSKSLVEVAFDACGLLDAGLCDIASGLAENSGPLEMISLRRNCITCKRVGSLAAALCQEERTLEVTALDLSGNPLGVEGAKEIARILAADGQKLRQLTLQDCALDLAAFWRIVGKLDDNKPLTRLDLRCNPIGRGTRRCWRSTMGPTLRCEVQLSNHPLKARKEALAEIEDADLQQYPLPSRWI